MANDSASLKLSGITILLHWIVGITIIGLIAVGIYMEENEVYSLYPIHKSVGIIIFMFVVLRILWRIKEGWPVHLGNAPAWQNMIAKLIHWVLIIATFLFPVSGMLMSAAGGHGLAVFGMELYPMNFDPANPQKTLPLNKDLAGLAHSMHGFLGTAMIAVIALHAAAAIKHHIIDKDATLLRMLGKAK